MDVAQLQAAPTQLKPDSAYILVRVSTAKPGIFAIQPVLFAFQRIKSLIAYREAKSQAFKKDLPKLIEKANKSKGGAVPTLDNYAFDYKGTPNIFAVKSGKFLVDGKMRTVLLEVPAGAYILYGTALDDRGFATCNCLGTVKFTAKTNVITDTGSIYSDKAYKEYPIPNLGANLGNSMFQYGFIFGQALVFSASNMPAPDMLKAFAIELEAFKVITPFNEPGASFINRLAPIPGVPEYQSGKAVDVKLGEIEQSAFFFTGRVHIRYSY